ncbi:MAG: LexA family transcriptional regulator [Pyrodictiaceae archaeon]
MKKVGEDSGGASEDKDPLEVLGGTGLRVYLFMLRAKRPLGVRELQRRLGFKSPSTAKHHLERLVLLGLAEKKGNGYVARRPRGILAAYIVLAGRLVPRSLVTAVFSATATVAYALLPGSDPIAVIVLAVITLLLLYDALDSYRSAKKLMRA